MNEDHVIAALKAHLISRGYTLVSECNTQQRGVDLVMRSATKEIRIEAKGSTSAREGSARFGKQFTDAQCHDHFSRAFFKACQMRDETFERRGAVLVAIGLSHTKHFQKYCERTARTRKELGIGVFWVMPGGKVELAEKWEY